MIDGCGEATLVEKAVPGFGRIEPLAEDFESDAPAGFEVVGFIHLAHAAFAEQSAELVGSEALVFGKCLNGWWRGGGVQARADQAARTEFRWCLRREIEPADRAGVSRTAWWRSGKSLRWCVKSFSGWWFALKGLNELFHPYLRKP